MENHQRSDRGGEEHRSVGDVERKRSLQHFEAPHDIALAQPDEAMVVSPSLVAEVVAFSRGGDATCQL